MGINPASDLIVDVMRQADPVKVREAAERLVAAGRAPRLEKSEGDFAAFVKNAIGEGSSAAKRSRLGQAPVQVVEGRPSIRVSEKMSPGQQLESFVLMQLIETMMPKNADSVFGSGTAGSYWRSMLAEKLAAELTMAGGVGLGEQLGVNGMGEPEKAAEMLDAALSEARTSSETAVDASNVAGPGELAVRAIREMMSPIDGTQYAKPETNGA